MKKFKILGYSNPITFNCVPLITIIEINNKINAFFPDCTIKKLNIRKKEELTKLENYTPEVNNKFISDNEFSYINFNGKIETNNPKELLKEMKLDLKKLDKESIHKHMLEELILSETIKLGSSVYKKEIPDHAKKILLDIFKNEICIPIDINQICLQNNISISENNKMKYEGRIFQNLKNDVKIEYKSINNTAKERFTIAHELGHYFLHFNKSNSFNDTEYNFNDKSFIRYAARLDGEARDNDMEAEASFFAAELLMPDEEVIKYICSKDWNKHIFLTDLTAEMSNYFSVSRNSLILKLRHLEFLEKKDPQQVSETSNLIINQNTLKKFLDRYIPQFITGDTVKIAIRIKEDEKERLENFVGVCIALRGQGTSQTFTVRKIGANGIGVERIFPFYSENIKSITVIKRGRMSRKKLFYLKTRKMKKIGIGKLRSR
jgi:large subunit ribosomal protein L19